MAENNSFTSHFVELRTRLLHSLIFIFIAFIISYIFAEEIYNKFIEKIKEENLLIQTGIFGAKMQVKIINEGPVTLILSSD